MYMYILVLYDYWIEGFSEASVCAILALLENHIIFKVHIILCNIFKYVVYSVSFKLNELQQLK